MAVGVVDEKLDFLAAAVAIAICEEPVDLDEVVNMVADEPVGMVVDEPVGMVADRPVDMVAGETVGMVEGSPAP